MTTAIRIGIVGSLLSALALSCGSGTNVANAENARRAYVALDRSIGKALDLAMAGYSMSSSANFPEQMTAGDVTGTLAAAGQVSRGMGTSGNSEVRISTTYTTYQDRVALEDGGMLRVTYDAGASTTRDLSLSLRNLPNGTFTGTFVRTLTMTGDLTGEVTLNVALSGMLQPNATGGIQRVPGTTRIMGTAMSPYGTFNIDVMQ